MSMSLITTGQDLYDEAERRLLGYGNALDEDTLLSYLNEGKDAVWGVLKSLDQDYFLQTSQYSDNTQNNYFGPLSTTVRQYTLMPDFMEYRGVEVVPGMPSGFEQTVFRYLDIADPDWKSSRRSANVQQGTTARIDYFFTIFAKNQLLFAQFPEVAFQLQWFYVRKIPDFQLSDSTDLDEVILPYTRKIADFAVKKAMLGLQDQDQFQVWRTEWKDDIVEIATGSSPRNEGDPVFVSDFLG